MQNSNIETVKEKLFSTKDSSEKMNDEIKSSILRMKENQLRRLRPTEFEGEVEPISEEDYAKVSELSDFIAEHIQEVGKEQTILDFQVGLNLLNDYRKESLIDSKVQLKEDSDFGEKSYSALLNALQHYPVDIIKRYVRLGALNNQIWNTKNLQKIDTNVVVENTANKMTERTI